MTSSPLDIGFHGRIPAALYHADPCPSPSLSSSLAALMAAKSPAHAFLAHPRLGGKTPSEETPAMGFGSVVHEIALGSGGGFSVWDGDTWRGGEAQRFRADANESGKTAIKRADYDRARDCVDALKTQLASWNLGYVLEEGASEQVAVWQSYGHYMRAMYDRWIPARNEIWDIKTTGKGAHPDQISRIVTNMGYDLRSEFYLLGAEALTGLPSIRGGLSYQFIFVETEPPYSAVPCWLDPDLRKRGRRLAEEAMRKWGECCDSGIWPGYVSGAVEIAAQKWVEYEEEEEISPSEGV
jgi:hypothetical protein